MAKHSVLVLVTGGIAAYKSCALVRRLMEVDCQVKVAMTPSATEFVSALTFEALSGNPVTTEIWSDSNAMEHIELAKWADAIIVAPATANTIAKYAQGIADDVVTTLLLAAGPPDTGKPVIVAPAMNTSMWEHPATQANLATLRGWGVRVTETAEGLLACRTTGAGKLLEPEDLREWVLDVLDDRANGRLRLDGEKLLVSAGATREFIDPFRFLSNPSTGRMGVAIAGAAARAGAEVTLVHGHMDVEAPSGVEAVPVGTAAEMLEALDARFDAATGLIMTAAVADFTPVHVANHKIKKAEMAGSLALKSTADILKTLTERRRDEQVIFGFAAESQDHGEQARKKLTEKRLDGIFVNNILSKETGFGAPTNAGTLVLKDGTENELPVMPKRDVARRLLRGYFALIKAHAKNLEKG